MAKKILTIAGAVLLLLNQCAVEQYSKYRNNEQDNTKSTPTITTKAVTTTVVNDEVERNKYKLIMEITPYKNLFDDKNVSNDTVAYYYNQLNPTLNNIETKSEKIRTLENMLKLEKQLHPTLPPDSIKLYNLGLLRSQLLKEIHTIDAINTRMIATKSRAKTNTNTHVTIYIDNRGHNPDYSKK
jgi:hypothetical protein